MLIVYRKDDGRIIRYLQHGQDPLVYYTHYPEEFKENLAWFQDDEFHPSKYKGCYIDGGLVKKYSTQELQDLRQYGRIISSEERLLNQLKPSPKEVREAEQTIKILTLIQEVI